MSEYAPTSTTTDELDDEVLLAKLHDQMGSLNFEMGAFLLADAGQVREGERLEPMTVDVNGGMTQVIRHRFSEKINQLTEYRERYWSIQEIGRPILLFMDADLGEEDKLVDAGAFGEIAPLHEKLARQTALGFSSPEVTVGKSHDIHHFSLLVRDALQRQKTLLAATQAR